MEDTIDLRNNGFKFAVESIEENIGTIEAYQVNWNSQDGIKKETKFALETCRYDDMNFQLANVHTEARRK